MLGSCQFLRYVTPAPCGNWEKAYIKQNAGTDENEDRHNNINNKLYRQVGSMAIKLPVRNQGCHSTVSCQKSQIEEILNKTSLNVNVFAVNMK